MYRSSKTEQLSWIFSNQSIEAPGSLPGRTLGPLYQHYRQKVKLTFDYIHFLLLRTSFIDRLIFVFRSKRLTKSYYY